MFQKLHHMYNMKMHCMLSKESITEIFLGFATPCINGRLYDRTDGAENSS